MPWGVAAAVAGAAVSAYGSNKAAKTQAQAAGSASDAQLAAARESNDLQREMFNTSRNDQMPWLRRGDAAGNRLAGYLGVEHDRTQPAGQFGTLLKPFTGADLTNDPGYKFRLAEGNKALDRSASARGGLYSGAALKSLNRYNQDYAGTEFSNAFNRDQVSKNQLFNMLSGVSGTGQTSAAQVGQQGVATGQGMANAMNNAATQVGNNMIGAGNARASGYLAQGNALTGAMNQGAAAWQRYGGGYGSTGSGTQAPAYGNYDTTGYNDWARYGSGGD